MLLLLLLLPATAAYRTADEHPPAPAGIPALWCHHQLLLHWVILPSQLLLLLLLLLHLLVGTSFSSVTTAHGTHSPAGNHNSKHVVRASPASK